MSITARVSVRWYCRLAGECTVAAVEADVESVMSAILAKPKADRWLPELLVKAFAATEKEPVSVAAH